MDKTILIAVLSIAVVLGTSLTLGILGSTPASNIPSTAIGYTGVACVQVIRADGTVEDNGCRHNLITTYGLEYIKSAVNGTASNFNLANLTVGGNTSALAASDTDLANMDIINGVTAAAATYARIGNGNSSLNYQWTETTSASVPLNTTGIYNATLGGAKLFAEASWTPSTTLQVGDKLNVTYYWWIA